MQNKNKTTFWEKIKFKLEDKKLLYSIIACLILSNAIFIFEYFSKLNDNAHFETGNRYSLLNPSRNLYDKKDLIVNVQPLRDQLNEIGKDPAVSVYFEFLNTGANISINKDLAIWPASLMKIPIAMAVMKKIENGTWQFDNELILTEQDKDDRFGELYKSANGTHFTIEKLLEEMLVKSDNTARTILMRNLEKKDIDEVLEHLGIEDIFDSENKVTAKKYSIFWRSLYTASFLSDDNSQKLIEIMSKSETNNYLSLGIPKSINFSHKIGVIYEDNIYADSGIVYEKDRPYILTVMTTGHAQAESEKIIKEISEKVYKYVSNY